MENIPGKDSFTHLGFLLVRLMCGLILFTAGAGKLFGWFGGFGMDATIQGFATMNFSPFWAYVCSITEFTGGLLLIPGVFTRPAAFLLFINMLVAVIVTGTEKFFMGGAAYPALLMICFLYFTITGGGLYSIDHLIRNRYLKAK